jgi:serine/threonine protein kinase
MVPRSLFKNYGEGATQRRLPNAQQMQQATTEYLKEMTKDTVFFQENPARPVAMFASSELIFGKAIGMGEFGTVVQVEGTRLSQEKQLSDCPASNLEQQSPSQSLSTSPQTDSTHRISKSCADLSLLGELDVLESFNCKEEDFQHQKGLRSRIASNVITANQSSKLYKYAVKQIRKDLYPAKRVEAAKGLAREQKFLASIAHPNIVRLRGIVSKPGFETNMMVLDKLEQSLLQQAVDWKTQSAQLSSFVFPWQSQQRVQVGKDILAGRLLALYDIAQAVKYLHSKR